MPIVWLRDEGLPAWQTERQAALPKRFSAAALRAEVLVEGALQRAQCSLPVLALDRLDGAAFAARREREAGKPRLAVDEHGAGAAFAAVAAALRAGEAEALAQVIDEQERVLDQLLARAAVDIQRDALAQVASIPERR